MSGCGSPTLCSLGCLDDDETLAAAHSLGQQGIQLVTVTIGPEWATPGGLTLAGSLGAVSVASAGCGANCQSLVLNVLSAADQVQARQVLGARLAGCAWDVPAPEALVALDVEVDQVPLHAGDFSIAGQRVWLGAAACDRVRAGAALAIFAR
ncbi:MAG: hypothetical protein IT380_03560 [Myxococcales bacterium]|nr:hypothetical protein [Myxococcales bacterium]